MGSENNWMLQKSKSRRRAYLRPAYVIARVIREARTIDHNPLRRAVSSLPAGGVFSSICPRRRGSVRFYLIIFLATLFLLTACLFKLRVDTVRRWKQWQQQPLPATGTNDEIVRAFHESMPPEVREYLGDLPTTQPAPTSQEGAPRR